MGGGGGGLMGEGVIGEERGKHSCQLSLFQMDSPTFLRAVPPKI